MKKLSLMPAIALVLVANASADNMKAQCDRLMKMDEDLLTPAQQKTIEKCEEMIDRDCCCHDSCRWRHQHRHRHHMQ